MKCKRTGKIGYRKKLDAQIKAFRVEAWHRVSMRVYKCPYCRLWHTARRKKRHVSKV